MEYDELKDRQRGLTAKYIDKNGFDNGYTEEEDVVFLIGYAQELNSMLNNTLESLCKYKKKERVMEILKAFANENYSYEEVYFRLTHIHEGDE